FVIGSLALGESSSRGQQRHHKTGAEHSYESYYGPPRRCLVLSDDCLTSPIPGLSWTQEPPCLRGFARLLASRGIALFFGSRVAPLLSCHLVARRTGRIPWATGRSW